MATTKKKKAPPAAPLPNNGTIQAVWGEKGAESSLNVELQLIHYALNESTGVAVCTLNEPKSLNCLSPNQIWEYFLILQHAARDEKVKVLVWTGHGRAFSSGANLSGAKPPPPPLPKEAMQWFIKQGFSPALSTPEKPDPALKSLTLAFWDFPKPSIVAVNGLAVGGAANIALANFHDLVIASTNAKFKYPFADLGFTPELGSSLMMPMLVGMANAKKLMMLGDWFDAHEAVAMGLVNEVTSPENLLPRSLEIAQRLAKKSPVALRNIKNIMNGHIRKNMASVMDIENTAFIKTITEVMAEKKQSKSKL